MPTLLESLRTDEVTVCRRPAVPGANMAVVKSDPLTPSAMSSRASAFITSLRAALLGVAKSDEDKATVTTAMAEAEAALSQDLTPGTPAPDPKETDDVTMSADVTKALADAAAAAAADREKLTKQMEAQSEAIATLTKALSDQTELMAVAKSEADAKAILGNVSGDVKALGTLLRKASPDERAALEASYAAANAIAKTAAPTRFAGARVLKMEGPTVDSVAKELKEKDAALTEAQAIVKAATMNPELYEAEVRAQRAAAMAEGY